MNNPKNDTDFLNFEIFAEEVITFFKKEWLILLCSGFLGLSAALIYILSIPSQYEGLGIISAKGSEQIKVMEVEGIETLVGRAQYEDNFFSDELYSACNISKDGDRDAITKIIKFHVMKRDGYSFLEARILSESMPLANSCINYVADYFKSARDYYLELLDKKAKLKILENEDSIAKIKSSINNEAGAKSDPLGLGGYLLFQDEFRSLIIKNNSLKEFRETINEKALNARVLSVTVKKVKVFNGKLLFSGLIFGLFLGCIFVFIRWKIQKIHT